MSKELLVFRRTANILADGRAATSPDEGGTD